MKAHGARNQVITSLKPPAGQPAAKWLLAGILALLLIATIGTAAAAGTAPDAPTDLTAVADTNADPQAAIALNWTASASDGGSEITRHEYRWNAGNANWWTEWTAIPDSKPGEDNASNYTVTSLLHPNPPQVYTFEVRAKNANGSSVASNQASDTFDVPATIAELRTTFGDQKVSVKWDTPENNGRKITHYQYAVFATREGESTHTVVWPQKLPGSDGDTTSATISGLTNGLPHIIGIGAVNATVTGGTIRQARRLDAPSNIRWRITVKPAGASGVRVQLPTTADCNATGAVCTSDGRKLSTSLDFTVPRAP